MKARTEYGVSDLSLPEITFIVHGIYLYLRITETAKCK